MRAVEQGDRAGVGLSFLQRLKRLGVRVERRSDGSRAVFLFQCRRNTNVLPVFFEKKGGNTFVLVAEGIENGVLD